MTSEHHFLPKTCKEQAVDSEGYVTNVTQVDFMLTKGKRRLAEPALHVRSHSHICHVARLPNKPLCLIPILGLHFSKYFKFSVCRAENTDLPLPQAFSVACSFSCPWKWIYSHPLLLLEVTGAVWALAAPKSLNLLFWLQLDPTLKEFSWRGRARKGRGVLLERNTH